jgi:hypothetical protein
MDKSQAIKWNVIYAYTRQMAFDDGVLVDLMQPDFLELIRDAGIKIPVAMTAEAFHDYVKLSEKAKEACNDIKGRLWDVLWMFRQEFLKRKNTKQDLREFLFQFLCVREQIEPELCTLKAVLGPGDTGELVITLMHPWED